MMKDTHEIRDPIHVFIRLDTEERMVLDSHPFQRLRQIHQLAMTYLVYPGATHRRFEHSLGVMELSSRVFDAITAEPIHDQVRSIIPSGDPKRYWRRVLRMAALCHDLGHLPFSHAAEKELLPEGWDHERITAEIIKSDEMREIWEKELTIPLKTEDIIKVALGPEKAKKLGLEFSDWETILSEIITGDTFGVDRIDYLLRDSLHAGVAYGKFDHYRLIDTLCILPKSEGEEGSTEPTLGLTSGGIQSAEALLWARYFMYSQVYFHHVRRIYDIHLKDFLKEWLPNGKFPTVIEEHLAITDNEVIVELRKAALDETHPGHIHAKRIIEHKHFKRLYERNPDDQHINLNSVEEVYKAACNKFGPEAVRCDQYEQKDSSQNFPVLQDKKILTSTSLSDTLAKIPVAVIGFVFIDRVHFDTAEKWLDDNRNDIIKTQGVID
jgi:HD superfamily phosphohydrolase